MTYYIEEMMKTAGVKPRYKYLVKGQKIALTVEKDWLIWKFKDRRKKSIFKVSEVKKYYPDFTAEKQLEIIKLLFKKCFVDIQNNKINFSYNDIPISYNMDTDDFSQNLAALVNNLLKSLANEDKEKVKEILER